MLLLAAGKLPTTEFVQSAAGIFAAEEKRLQGCSQYRANTGPTCLVLQGTPLLTSAFLCFIYQSFIHLIQTELTELEILSEPKAETAAGGSWENVCVIKTGFKFSAVIRIISMLNMLKIS
ncbi:hypothetical protein CRENBAI_017795 [Crenichthys baileyi]|uniref:Uncharacterized protein n=1 Tax=Crenichthys baileyi TaxID=28760 RepID=A0AAV9SPJ9_9TELE